jgi:hypothetical protein
MLELLVAVSCCFVSVCGTMGFHVQDLLHALQVEEPLLPFFESELLLVVGVPLENLIHQDVHSRLNV